MGQVTSPKISIVIPVRNGGIHFRECLNAILAQQYHDFEVLILNNNSTDGTNEYAQSVNDARIQIFRSSKDLTIEENWSRILGLKKAEFMTMIGHDDVFYPNYLSEMMQLIDKNPEATLYQSHFNYIDNGGKKLRDCQPMKGSYDVKEFLIGQFTQTFDSMGTGYIFRSKDFDDLGGMDPSFPNILFSDYKLWVSLIEKGRLAICSDTCFGYRLHQNVSLSTGADRYRIAFEKYLEFLLAQKKNPLIEEALNEKGAYFLKYFCQSLSHRLVKSPPEESRISVTNFINRCIEYSEALGSSQHFNPRKIFKIRIAEQIDNNAVLKKIFTKIKR